MDRTGLYSRISAWWLAGLHHAAGRHRLLVQVAELVLAWRRSEAGDTMAGLVPGAMRRSPSPVMVVLASIGWALLAWGAVLGPLVDGAVIGGVVTGAVVAASGTPLHASGALTKGR